MTHELLKGRRWYSTHGELEPKVVAKAMYQRVVGQMRSCCLGQTFDQVIQGVSSKISAIVTNKE